MDKSEKSKESPILKAYLSCRDGLVRSIMKMCARQDDVDDILQETFLRVLNANEKSRIKSPQDYLFVVSRNLVIEKLSLRSREIVMEINDAMVGIDDISADRELHHKQKLGVLNEVLQSLPEKKRRAILLRKFYGLSHNEIAKKMNVSVSSVEKYIAGGIKQCKRVMSSKGYEFEGHSSNQPKISHEETSGGAGKE